MRRQDWNMSQISVIIPLYNKERFIKRALDSVFAQTFQDFDVIVIDDGSTDRGTQIVKSYNDERLRLIEQTNAGPGAARNRGINESHAEYIAFLDADDEWLPSYLEENIQILKNNPDCDLCISAWYQDRVSMFPRRDNVNIMECYQKLGYKNLPGKQCVRENMSLKQIKELMCMFFTSTVVVKRETALKYGGFYDKKKYTYGEDFYFWIQLGINHSLFRNTKPLAYYHNKDSSLAQGLYKTNSLEAFLIDPERIRQNCIKNRDVLEKWLASYALRNAHSRLEVGKIEDARFLVKKYPLMRLWLWEYTKLRIKIAMPWVIPSVRHLKKKLSKKPERKDCSWPASA
jgi:glycosyltransferase involved in cell wall biosynthesis